MANEGSLHLAPVSMDMIRTEPGYLRLYDSGELERRAVALEARLSRCDLCPRECFVDRLGGECGFCRAGSLPAVASVCDHHGEEPAISGSRGSGTIFFSHCTLRCVYCQNHQISQNATSGQSLTLGCHSLAERMLHLQRDLGCHNINLVSPGHFVPQIVRAVLLAVPMGLRAPLVYNTNAYDSLSALRELEGIVDIYLPDIKYASDVHAARYSRGNKYVGHARAAIAEMYRQVGDLVTDADGLAVRGLIVRHLVLPNGIAGSAESLAWLAEDLGPRVTVSVMAQYNPCHKATRVPSLARKITVEEYGEVLSVLDELGLENGWVQEVDAAENYAPDFSREGHPFEPALLDTKGGAVYTSPMR